jgi:class 3 adenylate cyclase
VPIYLDRHDVQNISAQDVADAHSQDVEIQERHGVRYHTYWFDPDRQTVFCLAEGPDQESVVAVHRESHGLMASFIMELDSKVALNNFLGSFPDHSTGTAYAAPALRAIVFTDVCGSVAQTSTYGDDEHVRLLGEHNELVRTALSLHDGREVKHTGDGIMAAFASVVAAVSFAIEVQRRIDERNSEAAIPFDVSIGISAGEPITAEDGDLFGAAVQLAARLCGACSEGDIYVTPAVRELCMGKGVRFEDLGDLTLKGLSDPTRIFSVSWREAV